MQTSKYEIGANLQGLEFRKQANEILAALASSNAGNLEPASAQAGTVWLDTSNDKKHLLKIRNKDNSSWGILCSIDAQSGAVDAIDAYNKQESDEKYALKTDKPTLATETKAGIVKLKNSITGKAEDVAVTEKAIAEAFACAKSENGYTRLPNGLILQWGTTTATKVTFPIAFNKRLNVSLTSAEKEGEFAVFIADEALIENPSNTGFSIQTTRIKGTPGDYFKFYWTAIGY